MLYAVCHPKLQGCTALHCTTIPRLHRWLGWVAVGAVVVVVDLLLCDCAAASAPPTACVVCTDGAWGGMCRGGGCSIGVARSLGSGMGGGYDGLVWFGYHAGLRRETHDAGLRSEYVGWRACRVAEGGRPSCRVTESWRTVPRGGVPRGGVFKSLTLLNSSLLINPLTD